MLGLTPQRWTSGHLLRSFFIPHSDENTPWAFYAEVVYLISSSTMSDDELLDSNLKPKETAWVIYLVGTMGLLFCLMELASLAYPWYLSRSMELPLEPSYWVFFPAIISLCWIAILFKLKIGYYLLFMGFLIRIVAFFVGVRFSPGYFPAVEIAALISLNYQLPKMKRLFL
ncbi:MAG TPA: hypothetical protein VK151_14215 [Fluviicola sp.]|nr:hypothetical protein [Fluviicola sp.]